MNATARSNQTLALLGDAYTSWSSLSTGSKLMTTFLGVVVTLVFGGCMVLLNAPPNAPHTKEVEALPGPKRPWGGWLLGNCIEIADHRDSLIHPTWAAAGATGRYLSLFAQERIYTFDPAATRYIFAHVDEFERPRDARTILQRVMGKGSLVGVNGAVHKRQRRVMDPAFSTSAIKDMVPAMFDKADELENLIQVLIDNNSYEKYASAIPPKDIDRVPGARKIDMLGLMNRMTTDVIGRVFFGHDFDSISTPEGSIIVQAFDRMTNAAHEFAPVTEAQNAVPLLDLIVGGNRVVKLTRAAYEEQARD